MSRICRGSALQGKGNVQKHLKDKVTDKKREQFKKRLDILTSFLQRKSGRMNCSNLG